MKRREFLGGAVLAAGALAASGKDPEKKGELPGQTKNTKFACNIEMWFRNEPDYLKRLEGAAKLGYPAVEFWPWQGKNINAIAETCERLKLVVSQFSAWGFKPGLNDPKNHNQFVETIDKSCEVAKKLNCRLMCVVGGDDIKGMTQQQMHENIITGLKRAAPIAEKNGVTMILEAMNIRVDHKGHCLYGSAPTLRIIKAVNSPAVKALWDIYHMHITEGDICGHLREGFKAKAIAYIQIADHPGRHEPGTGEIHYPRVLRELTTLGYTGYVGLECVPSKNEEQAAWAVHKADQW
jgi:hydroxypyruvate isomerase